MLSNLIDLGVLVFLQAVLGFDNLLYLSIESKRAPKDQQSKVRRVGIIMAVALRIGLLFLVLQILDAFNDPFLTINIEGVITGSFNFASVIFLAGGVFIIYTAFKEINHMLRVDKLGEHEGQEPKSVAMVLLMIVIMNLVFSFDSILSAVAITRTVWVLATAIIISGLGMLLLADRVAEFLERNRKYEVLGLFILFIVGLVLLGEGGHVAELKLFGQEIHPMTKMTFYFSIFVLVVVDVLQTKYQKKLEGPRQLIKHVGPSLDDTDETDGTSSDEQSATT